MKLFWNWSVDLKDGYSSLMSFYSNYGFEFNVWLSDIDKKRRMLIGAEKENTTVLMGGCFCVIL